MRVLNLSAQPMSDCSINFCEADAVQAIPLELRWIRPTLNFSRVATTFSRAVSVCTGAAMFGLGLALS